MTTDFLAGLGGVIAGIGSAGLGLYFYVGGDGAAELYRRSNTNTAGLFGHAAVVFLLPAGVGFLLLGLAFVIGKNAFTTNMLVAALGSIAFAWLIFFIHPKWIQPKWMRETRRIDRTRLR